MTGTEHLETVQLEIGRGGIATLTLDRPEHYNALTHEMVTVTLPDTFAQIASDSTISALIVTGRGKGFCAGADLSTATLFEKGGTEKRLRNVNRTIHMLYQLEIPTIAAVNGPAAGAGLGLALACDIRLGAPRSKYVSAFFDLGIVPDFGVSWFLPRAVGTQAALEMIYSSRRVDAEEAVRLGLIARIDDDVVAAAETLAQQIAVAPNAARLAKANVRRGALETLENVLYDAEPVAQGRLVGADEFNGIFPKWAAQFRSEGAPD